MNAFEKGLVKRLFRSYLRSTISLNDLRLTELFLIVREALSAELPGCTPTEIDRHLRMAFESTQSIPYPDAPPVRKPAP